jgi:transposase
MWLSDRSTPDHNTINRFRSRRLKGVLKEVFSQIVQLLVRSGHLRLDAVYVDVTKIEANANRYTAVWAKGVATQRAKLLAQTAAI